VAKIFAFDSTFKLLGRIIITLMLVTQHLII